MNYDAEIARVKKALAETKSEYLRRDYEKYLRKLINRKRNATKKNGDKIA